MISQSLLLPKSLRALILIGLLGWVSWVQAVTLPDKILYQDGYSVVWQGTESFNEDLRDHFTVIGGNTNDAGLVQQLRSEGKVFAYTVGYNASFTSQQLVDLWSTPFNNTLGGTLPGGFDAIEIDEILPYANGTVESNRIVAALAQLRAEYPDKIIATFTGQGLGWDPATYSNLWNGINNYADLNLFEAYIDERAAPGNVLWHANMAILIDNQTPGLIDKTIFALLSYQGSYPADTTTDVGFWGFLDAQMHAIRNHPVASRMPGVGSYKYTVGLTTDFMGQAMDHYYVQGNTDYFGDGDLAQDVSNSQFENSTAGWNLATGTGGWTGIFNYNAEGIASTHDLYNRTSHGDYGLKTIRGTTANEASYTAVVEAGQTYNVSAYVHGSSGSSLNEPKLKVTTNTGFPIAELQGSEVFEPAGMLTPWRHLLLQFEVPSGQENVQIVLSDENASVGSTYYWDFVELEDAPGVYDTGPPLPDGTWILGEGGNWNTASNWAGNSVPNGNDQIVTLGSSVVAPATVFTNDAVTAKKIVFDSAHTVAVAGTGLVHLEADTGSSRLEVLQGTHTFQVRVEIHNATVADITQGATLKFSNQLDLNGNSLVKAGEGELLIRNTLLTEGGVVVGVGGTITGSGTVAGDLENPGATVAPGNSPGTLTISGDFTQGPAGTLQVEIAGTGSNSQHDVLAVGGELRADGTLEVLLTGGYQPAAGERFDILDFGNFQGQFSVNLPELGAGLAWDTSSLYATGELSIGAIPEPATLVLAILSVLCSAAGFRRASRAADDTR